MEFTQFISYLDYGVLGLSAIILILSFVLLSREQQRDVFRPEVAKAIRRYMMLALAFAAVGLISTVVDGVMVRPAKKEKKMQDERTDLLAEMIARDVEKRIGLINVASDVPAEVEDTVPSVEIPAKPKSNNKPKPNAAGGTDTPDLVVPDSTEETNVDSIAGIDGKSQVETNEILVIIEQYHLNKDKNLGKGVVNNLKEKNVPAANIIEQRLMDGEK